MREERTLTTQTDIKTEFTPAWKLAIRYSKWIWAFYLLDTLFLLYYDVLTTTATGGSLSFAQKLVFYPQLPGFAISLLFVERTWSWILEPNMIVLGLLNCVFWYVAIFVGIAVSQLVKRRRLCIPFPHIRWRRVAILIASVAIIITAFRFYQFRSNFAPLEIRELPQPNPESWVFPATIETLTERIKWGMHKDTIRTDSFFTPLGFVEVSSKRDIDKVRFSVWTREDEWFGREIFADPANSNDLFITPNGDALISRTYFLDGKPVDYLSDYHLHLEPVGSDSTRVTVIAVNPRIQKGYRGGVMGISGLKFIPVEPTTIEEYCILLYIGNLLGDTTMPPLTLPEPL